MGEIVTRWNGLGRHVEWINIGLATPMWSRASGAASAIPVGTASLIATIRSLHGVMDSASIVGVIATSHAERNVIVLS